jgi:hypothetical protein
MHARDPLVLGPEQMQLLRAVFDETWEAVKSHCPAEPQSIEVDSYSWRTNAALRGWFKRTRIAGLAAQAPPDLCPCVDTRACVVDAVGHRISLLRQSAPHGACGADP